MVSAHAYEVHRVELGSEALRVQREQMAHDWRLLADCIAREPAAVLTRTLDVMRCYVADRGPCERLVDDVRRAEREYADLGYRPVLRLAPEPGDLVYDFSEAQ